MVPSDPESAPLIYILDDDPAIGVAISFVLRSFGWRAKNFIRTADYLEGMRESMPQCVLMDLHLSERAGPHPPDLMRMLRGRAPVIAITGDADDAPAANEARQAGAVDVLTKPIQPDELKMAIESALLGVPPAD